MTLIKLITGETLCTLIMQQLFMQTNLVDIGNVRIVYKEYYIYIQNIMPYFALQSVVAKHTAIHILKDSH